jgi:hypothetical protein
MLQATSPLQLCSELVPPNELVACLSPHVVGGEAAGVARSLAKVWDLDIGESIEQPRKPLSQAGILVRQAVEAEQKRAAILERHQFGGMFQSVPTLAFLDVFLVSRAVQKPVEVLQLPPIRVGREFQHGVQG